MGPVGSKSHCQEPPSGTVQLSASVSVRGPQLTYLVVRPTGAGWEHQV